MARTRIFIVYYRFKEGGFCQRLLDKMQAYLDQEWEVHYAALSPFPLEHPSLKFHRLPQVGDNESVLFWLLFFLTAPWSVLFIGMRVRPHLISVFSPVYALICAPLKWVTRKPLVLFIRSLGKTRSPGIETGFARIEWFLDQFGLRVADHIITNSRINSDLVKEHLGSACPPIEYLPNNLPAVAANRADSRKRLQDTFHIQENSFIVSTSGRFLPPKNLKTLVRAVSLLPKDLPIALLLVGSGPQEPDLRSLATDLGIADHLIITGWQDHPPEWIAGTDLYVFPSLREGMSNALLEALACGLPCLVSRIPENMNVIDGEDCHFAPHQPQELADKIQRCMQDPAFRNALEEETKLAASRLDFDWGERLLCLVRPLLTNPVKS